jgi:hypothetical protein
VNQAIAKGLGWLFILIGVVGFVGAAGGTMAMSPSTYLLGLFPVNLLHNVAHILIGVWGVNAARSSAGATAFCKQAGILYLGLALLGFIPATADAVAGLLPLGGYDRFLHLALGAILCYGGFGSRGDGAS